MMVQYEYKGITVNLNIQADGSYGEIVSEEEVFYFSVSGGIDGAKNQFRFLVDNFLCNSD